jgi:hypothetical protein
MLMTQSKRLRRQIFAVERNTCYVRRDRLQRGSLSIDFASASALTGARIVEVRVGRPLQVDCGRPEKSSFGHWQILYYAKYFKDYLSF